MKVLVLLTILDHTLQQAKVIFAWQLGGFNLHLSAEALLHDEAVQVPNGAVFFKLGVLDLCLHVDVRGRKEGRREERGGEGRLRQI
jgi:hypothetical protein